MLQLFFTPSWFNGWDIAFEIISLVIALLIAGYSFRFYKLNGENKYAYFSLAFLLVAFSLLVKIFSSSVLYFTPVRDVAADVLAPVVGPGLQFSFLLYRAAFFLQMAPMLGAWLLIFFISQKARNRLRKLYEITQIALFIYLILLISIVSNFKYFVFYLTNTVLLGLIVLNYYKNYLNTDKNKNALQVMGAFLLLLAANISFVFVFLLPFLYVVGEIFMLIGFLLLLYTYATVRKR